jgi:hypothetical protein
MQRLLWVSTDQQTLVIPLNVHRSHDVLSIGKRQTFVNQPRGRGLESNSKPNNTSRAVGASSRR